MLLLEPRYGRPPTPAKSHDNPRGTTAAVTAVMRQLLPLLLLAPAAACTDTVTTTEDRPYAISASGDTVIVAAATETTTEGGGLGFGCGGPGIDLGPSVLFVSADAGATFERIAPEDDRPLTRIAVRSGVFYALAQEPDGNFSVVTSPDGRAWTEIPDARRVSNTISVHGDDVLVAHAHGLLASSDGRTFRDTRVTQDDWGLYLPLVARVGNTTAIASQHSGELLLSTDAETWTTHQLDWSIEQLISTDSALYFTGYQANSYGSGEPVVGRIDLTNPRLVTSSAANSTHAVVTPAGILDGSGALHPLSTTGLDAPTEVTTPFTAGAADGNRVTLLDEGRVRTSTDGGRTFGSSVELPIERIVTRD